MSVPTFFDHELVAYLLGGLAPRRACDLEQALQHHPALVQRLEALRPNTVAPPVALEPRWRLPSLASLRRLFSFDLQVAAVATMGGERLRPGETFEVRLSPLPDAASRRVLVLARDDGEWRVVFPLVPEDDLCLADLPTDAEQHYRLHLAARDQVGEQVWAVVLPLLTLEPQWGAPPQHIWRTVMDAVASGQVPAVRWEVGVGV